MFRKLITVLALAMAFAAGAADITFAGGGVHPIAVNPPSNTGLDRLYVLEHTDGVFASFTASSNSAVKWYRFGNRGGAYAEEVPVVTNGRTSSYELGAEDLGLIIEEGTRRYYFWVVNYQNHPLDLHDITISEESDCYAVFLKPQGVGDQILYYTINGIPTELSRELIVSFKTLEYDESVGNFVQKDASATFPYLTETMRTEAPLCDTQFTLSGDRFLMEWGADDIISTTTYQAIAVDAHTSAEQALREVDNETRVDVNGLGGSAPVDITFSAVVSDAVRFTEWQFSKDPEFNSFDLRFNDTEVAYTFQEYGTTYVRFQASNNDGTCDWFSETYEVSVGESKLQCPNVFSPNGDGVNDEWKVSYKSIISFECTIFNRWGVEIISFNDPSQGWDGKYGGKTVGSGVYFYVIKAVGADGRKYDLAGDINVINSTRRGGNGTGETAE